MKREIKFRGKSLETGEWLSGDLYHTDELTCICDWGIRPHTVENFAVNSDTVGQFTGLYDKNGKEIYEDDIVFFHYLTAKTGFAELFPTNKFYGLIAKDEYNCWCIKSDGLDIHIENAIKYGIVVGNVFDHPELLKDEK